MAEKREKPPERSSIPENEQPPPTTQPMPTTPPNAAQPLPSVGVPEGQAKSGYQQAAEQGALDEVTAEETRMESIEETGQPYSGPPPTAKITPANQAVSQGTGGTRANEFGPAPPPVGGTPVPKKDDKK